MLATCPVIDYTDAQPSALAAPYTRSVIATPDLDTWSIHIMNGTGSNCSLQFYRERYGYRVFPIIERVSAAPVHSLKPYARLMIEIMEGFGRTMTRIPVVFGVSRQTLYNWRDGETPKEPHQAKIVELAGAARVFAAAGFKPTAAMLDRTVAQGKSFLALLADGADGTTTARSLMRIVERSLASRARLEAALADERAVRLDVSDIGAPALDEDA